MAKILVESTFERYTDRTGRPLSGGKIYIGLPGQDPEQFPQPAYLDPAGTMQATQPVRTNAAGYPADADGNAVRLFTDGPYSIRVRDLRGVQVVYAQDSSDGFYGVTAGDLANDTDVEKGSDLVGYTVRDGIKGTTVGEKLRRVFVDVKDFGAVGDGLANDQDAFEMAASYGASILVPSGQYNVPGGDFSGVTFYSFGGAASNNPSISINNVTSFSFPVGAQVDFPALPDRLPPGFIPRQGQTLSRTVYPDLWAFAENSGNIVDDADWVDNQGAFSRGNGTTTFRIPNAEDSHAAYAGAAHPLGSRPEISIAEGEEDPFTYSLIISTPAIRAFSSSVNQGQIDIAELAARVDALANQGSAPFKITVFDQSGSFTPDGNTVRMEVELWGAGSGGFYASLGDVGAGGNSVYQSQGLTMTAEGGKIPESAIAAVAPAVAINADFFVAGGAMQYAGYAGSGRDAPRGGSGGACGREPEPGSPGGWPGGGGGTLSGSNASRGGSSGAYAYAIRPKESATITIGAGGAAGNRASEGAAGGCVIKEYR